LITRLRTELGDWFFRPVSPYPLAVFRILFGLCVCATLLLLHGDWLAWFGVHGWVSMDTIARAESGFRLNLFAVLPRDDGWITALYWVLLLASLTLTAGLGTRLSSIVVYLGLNSLNQRNPIFFHGGDTFLRVVAFFLIFAPAGAALSLDRVIRLRRGTVPQERPQRVSPWVQRLLQYQLAMVYLASFWWKMKGAPWRNGTALYYVLHVRSLARFPLPGFLYRTWAISAGGWLVMAFELLFPLLVWFRPFRRPLLVAGVVFHLCLEYALNIPMFQWDMLCAYPLFLEGDALERLAGRVAGWLRRLR